VIGWNFTSLGSWTATGGLKRLRQWPQTWSPCPWRKTVIDQLRQAEAERDEAVQRLETLKTSYAMESDAEPLNDRIDELEAKLTKARREASNLRAENASETLDRQFVRTNIAEGIVYRMRKVVTSKWSTLSKGSTNAMTDRIPKLKRQIAGMPCSGAGLTIEAIETDEAVSDDVEAQE